MRGFNGKHIPWYSDNARDYKAWEKGQNRKDHRSTVKETRANSFSLKNPDFVIGQKR